MKKIVTSIGMIVFAAAIVAGGTGAFFSDTETSTGNVFTAGAIDLTVDSEAHYNGSICTLGNWDDNSQTPDTYQWVGGEEYPVGLPCSGTWEATDLGAQTFFNFNDVKPGDEGENTISLHITSNPAWACVDVDLTKNDDVSSTEPELEVPGEVLEAASTMDGELAQNIKFAAWLDQGNTPGWQNSDQIEGNDDTGEGDNVWQGEEKEPLLFSNESGPASDVLGGKSYTLAAPNVNGGTPMAPNVTNYIGLAWCAGTQDVDTLLNTITCDGSTLGNIVQTDMMEASIAFRVEQARNNEDFRCEPQEVVPTRLTLAKTVTPAEVIPDSAFTLTATGPTNISGIEGAVSVTNALVLPGLYTLGELPAGPGGEVLTWSCTGNATPEGANTVTIALGESVTCEATNTYPPVQIPG